MKIRRMHLLVALASLCCTASVFGQRLDIAFEGPWVFYEDDSFVNASEPAHAIIAMVPAHTNHRDPTFSTGDGFVIPWKGVYCVTFGTICAPKRATTALGNDGYAPPNLLDVKAPAAVNWFGQRDR